MNTALWSMFMNVTLQAAIYLGQDNAENLQFVKNHLWKSVKQLSKETGKLINDQTKITGVKTIIFKELTWISTS